MEEITSLTPKNVPKRPSSVQQKTISTLKCILTVIKNAIRFSKIHLNIFFINLKLLRLRFIYFTKNINPKFYFLSFGTTALTSILVISLMLVTYTAAPKTDNKYSIFMSKPLVLEKTKELILGRDSRAATLNKVLDAYDCPMAGLGDKFVKEADKNGIPYWLVASVSFQESNCGKKTPKVEGSESYNAWGWGVWGDRVSSFNDWEEGISVVSSYMAEKFYAHGVEDTCEIMKTYTPPSNGSWCNGVNYFKDVIVHFKTPAI